jgi:hypothetical protein
MKLPAFFDEVPAIAVRDPLAALLGAAEDGRIEYRYADAVKLAGHSCPTVAGAWLMTVRALAALYPEELPERGNFRVELRGAQDEGVEGVIALVAGLVTGAAGPGGFKGIAGLHGRRGLLEFGAPIRGRLRVTRLDAQRAVEVDYHAERVPMPPELKPLLAAATAPDAADAARREFGRCWQAWVKTILIEHRDDPRLVEVHEVRPAHAAAPA